MLNFAVIIIDRFERQSAPTELHSIVASIVRKARSIEPHFSWAK